jgi:H+/Cl- antiporter ClcA
VILAGVVALALTGDYTYFGQPIVGATERGISFAMLGLALAAGISGGTFSRITLTLSQGVPRVYGTFRREHPIVFAALCGLCIAVIGALSGNTTYGTGYDEARSILEQGVHQSWSYAPLRALATLLSCLSGIPAGLLAPSLSVGAGLGQAAADLLHLPSAVPFAILGMCGFLAGVTQAPLTSLVIVMEMTSQHAMILPLMITAALATAMSKLISPPLYQSLAARYGNAPP